MDETLYRELAKRLKMPVPDSLAKRAHEFAIDMSIGTDKGAWGVELLTTRDKDKLKTWTIKYIEQEVHFKSLSEKWKDLTLEDIDSMVYRQFLSREDSDSYRLYGRGFDFAHHECNQIYTPMIFISYKHGPSSLLALLIAQHIKENNIGTPYLDMYLRSVKKQSKQLQKEVELCDVFVCVLDSHTLSSNNVRKEIEWAVEANKSLLFIWHQHYKEGQIEDKPHDKLKDMVDDYPATVVKGESAESYHDAIEKLIEELRNALYA
ncbi:MAG: TIR domain-containing protein [Anaerolineaceae bacterium]|nr:TIR domain-containing protein [Anaerolineaceae bacterium]